MSPSVEAVFGCLVVVSLFHDSHMHTCPAWFRYNETYDVCMCSPGIEGYISCCQIKNTSILHFGMSLGYNETENMTVVAYIPYIYPKEVVNRHLEIDLGSRSPNKSKQWLCSKIHRTQNLRENIFCGKCDSGYGPAIHSFGIQCAKCHWWGPYLYFSLQIVPITVFYVIVLVFKVDLTRPNMFHYILFCNVLTVVFRYSSNVTMNYLYSPTHVLRVLMKVSLTICGFWGLDFFRFVVPPFCFNEKMRDRNIPLLDLFPAVYLLGLTLAIAGLIKLHNYKLKMLVCVWKPFQKLLVVMKQNRDPWEALTHTYATFFFLYFIKIMYVAFLTAIITPGFTQMSTKPQVKLTVFYDPTEKYFATKHIAVLMTTFVVASILILPAMGLLIVFHTSLFQRVYRAKVGPQWHIILRTFVRTFQNGYKDGSRETRDFRSMAGWILLGTIGVCSLLIVLFRSLDHSLNLPWPIGCAFFITTAVVYGSLQPYKKRTANATAAQMHGLLAILANLLCFISQRSEGFYNNQRQALLGISMLLIFIVNMVFTVYIIYKIASYCVKREQVVNFAKKMYTRCRCPCKRFRNEEEQSLLHNPGLVTHNNH